jgi:hypothetical protein
MEPRKIKYFFMKKSYDGKDKELEFPRRAGRG